MKQNKRFLLVYTGILLSFALILIAFAGLTQNNWQRELSEREIQSQGMQKNLVELTDRNQQLIEQNKELTEKLEQLKAELADSADGASRAVLEKDEITRTLADALKLYCAGKKSEAAQMTAELTQADLTEGQKALLEIIHQ